MRIFHLEHTAFKGNPVSIPFRKWKKWVGIPKWQDMYQDHYLKAPFFCHEEIPKKHSLCWN